MSVATSFYNKARRSIWLLMLPIIVPFCFATQASDGLTTNQHALLDSVISTFHIEHCCGTSLKACVGENTCSIANRMHAFSLWLIEQDYGYSKIMEQMEKRYAGFMATKRHDITTANLPWAGSSAAPVRITAYISSTCNLCKHIVGALYDSITEGSLMGKAKLMAIPFGSGIGDVALYAAHSEGKFWQLFEAMRERKIRYKEDDIISMALGIGIQEKTIRNLLKRGEFQQMVARARADGTRNDVEVTPTFFINEKRYSSFKDPLWVIDAALAEYEMVDKSE